MRLISFLVNHWHGGVALVPTLLVTLLALRLLLGWLGALRPLDWSLTSALFVSVLSGLVLLWQLVGGARAVARPHDFLITASGALMLLTTAGLFLGTEHSHWVTRGEYRAKLLVVPRGVEPLLVRDGTVQIVGTIGFDTLNRFDATVKIHPEIRLVELQSNGGHVPTARALAGRIETAGLATRAVGLCASACTLVFMAGQSRSLASAGHLGFHAYRLERAHPVFSVADEEARDRAYLIARGVEESFVARAFATPPDQLWQPLPAELRAAGLLTD